MTWLVRRLVVLACALIPLAMVLMAITVTGCATTPQAVRVQCLPMKAMSPEEQKALADELRDLPQDSAIVRAIIAYGQMRAADRACLAQTPGPS